MSRVKQRQNISPKNDKEVNLRDFFDVFKRRGWVIAVVTIIAALSGHFYSITNNNEVSLYESSRRMIIGAESDMQTLMVMVKDPIIMGKVRGELGLSRPSEAIAEQIVVERLEK